MLLRSWYLIVLAVFLWSTPAAHAYVTYGTFEPTGVQTITPPGDTPTPYYSGSSPATFQGLAAYNSQIYGLGTVNDLYMLLGPGIATPLPAFPPPLPGMGGLAINNTGVAYATGLDPLQLYAQSLTGPESWSVALSPTSGVSYRGISGMDFAGAAGAGFDEGDLLVASEDNIYMVDFTSDLTAELIALWGMDWYYAYIQQYGPITSLTVTPEGMLHAGTLGGYILQLDGPGSVIPIYSPDASSYVAALHGLETSRPLVTPEPSTFALLGMALLSLLVFRKRLG